MIYRQTLAQCVGIVITSGATSFGSAVFDARKKRSFVNLNFNYAIKGKTLAVQHLVKRMRLCHGARKPVQNNAIGAIIIIDTRRNHPNDNIVRYKFATIHNAFGAKPKIGSGSNRRAKHIAS